MDADAPLGPTLMSSYSRGQRGLAEQDQKGAFFSGGAAPHVVQLGLSADDQFKTAADNAQRGLFPMDDGLAVEADLECAASWT
eukprot:12285634-Heterocapsa_arctica.AAC.1